MQSLGKLKLEELTTKIGSGATPKGGKNSYKETGISLIRSLNIYDLEFDKNGLAFIDQDQADNLSNVEVQENDVLINITGASVARCCKVPKSILPARVNQHVSILRSRKEKLNPAYLQYLLVSSYYKRKLLTYAQGGATRKALTKGGLQDFEIDLPPIDTQQDIVSLLSTYDDLIENNNRRIKILEEMARRIYREWFVHFRYPGHENEELVDSGTELGKIPEGWEIKQIQDIIERSNSGLKPIDHPDEEFYYYSFSAYDEGQRPEIIKGEEIKSRKYILDNDAVIISKLNPRIPRIWYAKPKTDHRCLTSTEFLILNGVDGISNAFVYSLLSSHKFYGRFRSLTGGTSTSHQRVKPKDFKKMEIALPKKRLLNKFQKKVGQLFDLAYNLREKNEKLKEIRDLLLPKLISGKIDVEEITVN